MKVLKMLAIVAMLAMLVGPMMGGKAAASKLAMPVNQAKTVIVEEQDFKFSPAEITISVGDTITFKNTGAAPHTAQAADASWDSGNMDAGATFDHTFTTAGTIKYYCKYHGSAAGSGMAGTIIVQAAAAEASPTAMMAEPTGTAMMAEPTGTAMMAEPTGTAMMAEPTATEMAGGAMMGSDTLAADDQEAEDYITVKSVHASVDGWIAVHVNTADNKPGDVIGVAPVKAGDNSNVRVNLNPAPKAGDKVWPMLHIDAGTIGTYEFPGPDAPVIINGNIVMQQITLSAMSMGGGASSGGGNTMPGTGSPLELWLVVALGLMLIGGGVFVARRRTA